MTTRAALDDDTTAGSPESDLPDRVVRFYEDLAARGRDALPGLDDLFAADVVFRDPFRETKGMRDFRVLFDRMFDRYREVAFSGFRLTSRDERGFTLVYDMRLRMRIGPTFVTPMASVFTVRAGKVSELVDYYDFATGLVSPLAAASGAYRLAVRSLFL